MRGASAEGHAVIEQLQPYHRRETEQHPLELLRVLSNIDKHRLLHLVLPAPKQIENQFKQAVGSSRLQVYEVAPALPIEGRTVVLRGRVIPGPDFENVKLSLQLIGTVVLSDGTLFEAVEPVLTLVREQVVPRLEGFVERES
jgi:hypothetical protein